MPCRQLSFRGVIFPVGSSNFRHGILGNEIACIFTSYTVNVLVVCCDVNDAQLYVGSVGWLEKWKPKQGTVVNQIFTEAKRVV